MPSKAETLSVRVPDAVRTQVEELARLTKCSRSFIVQEAGSSHVQEHADHMPELDEAVKSAECGIGHSREQIFGWMSSWGTVSERPSPEPDV